MGGVSQFIVDDSTGKITGYKTKAGADTVFSFRGDAIITSLNKTEYTIEEDGKYIIITLGNAAYRPILYVNNKEQKPIIETFQPLFSTYASIYELELNKSDIMHTHFYLLHLIKL